MATSNLRIKDFFNKKWIIIIFALLVLLVIILLIFASTSEKGSVEVPLVFVQVDCGEEVKLILDAGLELVQVDQNKGEIFIALYEGEREFLEKNDYDYEIIVHDIYRSEALRREFSTLSTGEGRADYRTWDDYLDEILHIAEQFSDIVKLHMVGHSYWGLPVYALEISDAPGVKDGRPESLHEGLIHATEWPSGEMAIELAWYLTGNYGSDERITDIVENIRTWIVPVMNPDGLVYHQGTGVRWRKNRRDNSDGTFGVDVNRNFSYLFGGHGSPDPGDWMSYWGRYPFSEPETQNYYELLSVNDFITVLRGHTYGETIFYEPPNECDEELYWEMLYRINSWNSYRPRLGGQGGQSGNFVYGVMRAISICLEYQKISQPPYKEGYPAPGLETDEFGMMKGNNIWDQFPVVDPWPVEEMEAQLIDCGMGLDPDEYSPDVEGNIALIKQNESFYCVFDNQYLLARLNGAAGLIIYNETDGFTRAPTIRLPDIDIPVMVLKGEDGSKLADHLSAGHTLTARMVPDVFRQDSFHELWERNLNPILYTIEQAAVLAPVIQGTVTDSVSGDLLPARLDKTVTLTAPFADSYGRELRDYSPNLYMEHTHHTFIKTDGSYIWHVSPSKQPRLETPPYEITATAPGYYPMTKFLPVDCFFEEHRLNFALQPVVELQPPFRTQHEWQVASIVPLDFIAVNAAGDPVEMDNIKVVLFTDGNEVASFFEGSGVAAINKGEVPGEYHLEFSPGDLGLQQGRYDMVISFSGPEGEQSYSTILLVN